MADSEDSVELVRTVLESREATVIASHSALEGLRAFEAEHPDLLISDIGMPEVDGYDLLRRVRQLRAERGRNVPAIAMTAYASEADRAEARRAGYDAHLPKPIDVTVLLSLVSSLATRSPPASSPG